MRRCARPKEGRLFLTLKLVLLIVLLSLAGTVIQRVSGFGFGIFVMMFLPMLLPYDEATTLSSILSGVSTIIVAWRLREKCEPRLVLVPLAAFAVLSTLSIRFVKILLSEGNQALLLRLLGAVLIALSLYFLFLKKRVALRPNTGAALGAGALSGVLSGLFSMGGPPMVLYLLAVCCDDNDRYMANIQMYFALTTVYATAVRAVSGFITARVLLLCVFGGAAALLGVAVGRRLFDRLRPEQLRTLVYIMMALSGLRYLILA